MQQTEIQVGASDLLAILERIFRECALYCAQPPENFSTENLMRHIARGYAFAEKLSEMAAANKAANAPGNGAEAN